MDATIIHPSRTCANCSFHDGTAGCEHGFPDDAAVCALHQTTAEADAGIYALSVPPASVAIPNMLTMH